MKLKEKTIKTNSIMKSKQERERNLLENEENSNWKILMTNINLNDDDDDEKKEFFFLSNEHNTVNGTQTERQYVKQKKKIEIH